MTATLTAERPKPEYTCAQSELYAGLDIIWNSQAPREAEFLAENTKYTGGLSATRKLAIEAARAMPDGSARYAQSKIFHIELGNKWELALTKWNSLAGYIEEAYEEEFVKTRLNEAGKGLYEAAAGKDWEKVIDLMKEGKNFITAHDTVLESDGGMPTTFAAAYDLAKTGFEGKYAEFMTAREDAQEQTDAKILANNAVYADGVSMMKDGKRIFRKNASVKERFTWERVLEMVSPKHGTKVVWEDDVAGGEIKSRDLADVAFGENSVVKIELSGSGVLLSAINAPGPVLGPTQWSVAIGEIIKPVDEFATLTGASEVNHFLKVQGFGPASAHVKITFSGLV
jgi:hypothetical protein